MNAVNIKIWDLPTRLFHWLLVFSIAFSWFSAEVGGNWMVWHERSGIFILSLLLFRLIWGFVGSDTARFRHFIKSPLEALQHFKEVKMHNTAYHAGHNPLGAWMVLALLGVLSLQGITGLFANDDIMTEGPLVALVSENTSSWLTSAHHLIFNIILLFAAIHIAAVLFYRLRKNTNLIKPMVLGTVDWPIAQQPQPQNLTFKPAWLGLVIWGFSYAVLYVGLKIAA